MEDINMDALKGERRRVISMIKEDFLETLKEVLDKEIMIEDLKERIYKKVKDGLE